MARVFFTGAFRKPRELNWTIGVTHADPRASSTASSATRCPTTSSRAPGIRIAYSIVAVDPVRRAPTWRSSSSAGNFPGTAIIPRFFILHVLIIPLIIIGLVGAHLVLLVRQKHTQFPGKGRTEHNVVGSPMFPVFMAKTTGFLLHGHRRHGAARRLRPDQPDLAVRPLRRRRKISYAVQPDWYMGWLDGALRIMPSWAFTGFGHTIPFEVFLPAVIFPGLIFNICLRCGRSSSEGSPSDNEIHNLLDRPRDRPKRTAAGVGHARPPVHARSSPAPPTCWPTSSTSRSTRCCGSSGSS